MADDECIPTELLNVSLDIQLEHGNFSFDFGGYHVDNGINHSDVQNDNNNMTYLHKYDNSNDELIEKIEYVLYTYVIVAISGFGLLGNILNLIVLTSKGLQKTMDRMEKSAHCGLVAMAVSDMCFCLVTLPHGWVNQQKESFYFRTKSFSLYYLIYSQAIINVFIMSSTWLTVTMSASRYLAIVHPLRAREIIGMTFAKASIVCVFILCVAFNLPRFWNETIDTMNCIGGWAVYFRAAGLLKTGEVATTLYMWIYFVIAILFPLVLLCYCNAYLIRALRQSAKMRRQYQTAKAPSIDSTHRITLTLVIIVIMYILLVSPAEIVNFLKRMVIEDESITSKFNLSLAILNTLQAINFSCNFILYCIINVHFRQTVKNILCLKPCKKKVDKFSSSYAYYDSMTATTTAV